ncbi:MAG TPA: hypothetical protein VH247_02840 [Thermoleophilaceae bacterium]|jgi:hypothetical protein|nr:hypothetical protein [Thermoleophilaceae bacterium]
MRVVRFTDVDPEKLDALTSRIDESDGPPEGVKSMGIQILVDRDQRTAVVLQEFDTADDMAASEAALDAMDPGDTPGTRASVDRCELKLEMKAQTAA